MTSNPVLQADEVHRAIVALIEERFPGMSPLVLLSAGTFFVSSMAAEVIQATQREQSRQLGARELEAILEGVFDTMRIQIRHHLNGLPTRQ